MHGHGAPEVERLGQTGFVDWVLKEPLFQIADGVPIDIDVEAQVCAPLYCLVEQGQIILDAPASPCDRMNRDAHDGCSGVLDFHKEIAIPVPLAFKLVGIGNIDAAKQYRLAGGVDEPVAADRDERELRAVRAVEWTHRIR